MKIFKLIIGLFSFLILLNGCSSSSNDGSEPVGRTYEDIKTDFSQINFVTGNNDIILQNLSGNTWDFRVIMPDVDFTNNKRPLVLTLHGCASCVTTDAHKSTACYVEDGYAILDPIILSPNSHQMQWFEFANQDQVLALIDLVTTFLPVDINKIVVEGYSDGGNAAWFFAETQSGIFSASVASASYYNTTNNGVGRQIPIPMYVIHGENDELFPIADVQGWVQASIASGSDITFVTATGLTHPEPCNYVSYMQGAANWLLNTVWN